MRYSKTKIHSTLRKTLRSPTKSLCIVYLHMRSCAIFGKQLDSCCLCFQADRSSTADDFLVSSYFHSQKQFWCQSSFMILLMILAIAQETDVEYWGQLRGWFWSHPFPTEPDTNGFKLIILEINIVLLIVPSNWLFFLLQQGHLNYIGKAFTWDFRIKYCPAYLINNMWWVHTCCFVSLMSGFWNPAHIREGVKA